MKLHARSLAGVALLALLAVAHADPRTALNVLAQSAGLDWPTTGDGCSLAGVSCSVGGDASSITSIQLDSLSLAGSLPDGIWAEFPKLNYFTAKSNALTGAVPAFAGTVLGALDLSDNQLSGPIPVGLGTLTSLKYVNLRGNPGICGGTQGYQKPELLKIDLDDSAAAPCSGVPATPTANTTTSPDAAEPSPSPSPSPDATLPSPFPDATLPSPDATLPSPSPAATRPSPTATATPSPPSVVLPPPSSPVTYANAECICSLSVTSDACSNAMNTYCATAGRNADACTQYNSAVTGTDEDAAAGFASFLIGRCFASFKPPATGYCACGTDPSSVDCSQATLQICAQKVQFAAGSGKAASLCLDLINASLGDSAAVVSVAALLSQNCTSDVAVTKAGVQLTMVLNGIDAQQFQVVYETAFKQVLADIVGGSPSDVQILKVQQLPGVKSSRRLLADALKAVQVTAFIPGNSTEISPKLTQSLQSGDFVARMQAQNIQARPVQNSVSITNYNPDPRGVTTIVNAPKSKSKSKSKIPIYAGVAAGVVVLLALCAVLTLFLLKRRRTKRFEQTLPMAKTWLEPNTEDLKPTPSAPMPPHSGRSPAYTVPPKPTTNHLGAYDATPVPLSARSSNPPDAPEVVVASDSPKAATTSARNRFWRQGSTTSEPPTAPLAPHPTSSITNPTSRFSSLPPVGSTHSAAAAAVAAEAATAGGSSTSKQAQQAERRKFWQQFELSWQANKTKPPAITTNAPRVEDDDDIPSSGTSWTSDHTTTPTGRAPQRSTYQNPFVNPKK